MISKKILAASVLAAMGTSAHAIGFKAGDWNMDISGSVNAYYTSTKCDTAGVAADGNLGGALSPCGAVGQGQSAANIQNGLLPGFVVFSASTKQNGYDIKGVISIDPGTTTGGNNGGAQTVGDNRRVYIEFGNATMGTIKLGRDIALFGQNAILNDMSLLAVGGGGGLNGAINTTLGSIGAGYVYTEFQPQVTYTAPAIGDLGLSVGIFQPRDFGPGGENSTPGFQGMATYSLGSTGKLWATFLNQSTERAGASDLDTTGYEVGGTLNFGGLGLTANYFTGEGLGIGLLGLGGFSANGQERDSDGYLLQATYKVGNTKFGANYGQSTLERNSNDRANPTRVVVDENTQYVLGVYHSLTPSLTIAGEYISAEQRYTGSSIKSESDTFAIGAILFF